MLINVMLHLCSAW